MTYKFRDKYADMERTKAYYEENPPKVGDRVVIVTTRSRLPTQFEECTIKAITERKRIVVDHEEDDLWAGKSFYRTGQNCKAPKGQTWLIPMALYEEQGEQPDEYPQEVQDRINSVECPWERQMVETGYRRGISRYQNRFGRKVT